MSVYHSNNFMRQYEPLSECPMLKPWAMPFWTWGAAVGEVEKDSTLYDVLVIGAGPTGLACAIDAQNAGFKVVLVDKGCLCNSLFHYPAHMTFFTTPELLEIGNVPFPSPESKAISQ